MGGTICGDGVERETYLEDIKRSLDIPYEAVVFMTGISYFVGMYLTFVHNRKKAKANFVLGVWAMCTLAFPTYYLSAASFVSLEWQYRFSWMGYMSEGTAHWIFSITYFSVAIKFGVLYRSQLTAEEEVYKLWVNKVWLIVANLVYYTMELTIFIYMSTHIDAKQTAEVMHVVSRFLPGLFMFMGILHLRRVLKRRGTCDSKKFFANEKAMLLHMSIFGLQFIFLIIQTFMFFGTVWSTENGKETQACRFWMARCTWAVINGFMCLPTVVLFTYIANKYGVDKTEGTQANYLLLFANKDTHFYEVLRAEDEHGKQNRYNRTARQNADLMIANIERRRTMTERINRASVSYADLIVLGALTKDGVDSEHYTSMTAASTRQQGSDDEDDQEGVIVQDLD